MMKFFSRVGTWLAKSVGSRMVIVSVLSAFIASSLVAWAAQTNYLGTVFLADSTVPANQLTITAGGSIKSAGWSAIISSTITRPANTTVYTANTGWANAVASAVATTFTAACDRNGQQILIPQIDIQVSAAPATKLQGILWLFSAAPTAINDNAAFTLVSADNLALTGNMQGFPFTLTSVQSGAATHSGISLVGITYHAQCLTGDTTIRGMVQVVNAYTPTSGEIMTIKLHALGAN